MSDRTPELVILALVGLLAVGGIALAGAGGPSGSAPGVRSAATVAPARIALIERRVEALRGLRFRHPVPVAVVSPAQARHDGLAEQARSQPPAEQQSDEELLKLLGLLVPDADMRAIEGAVFGEQVAGYYDPRTKRLALVRGAGVDDVTLAHELTHALEDQHFDLRRLGDGPGDDRSTAEQALAEGTATFVMQRYAARWPSETPLGDALNGLTEVTGGTPLPPYVLRSLIFPYVQGERFVQALRRTSGDWRLVDVALRDRPPATSAEILQPDRWLRAQQPLPIALGRSLPPRTDGWRRVAGSTLGEEDLAALLAPQSGPLAARRLTGGWRGGRYALWRRGALVDRGCPAPCRARDSLLLAVRMHGAREARGFGLGLTAWFSAGLKARQAGPGDSHGGLWRLPGGSFGAVRWNGPSVRAALAPSAALAQQMVS